MLFVRLLVALAIKCIGGVLGQMAERTFGNENAGIGFWRDLSLQLVFI